MRKAIEPLAGCLAIATRPPGYVLEADPESIAASRFTRLVADGLRRLGAGDPGGGVTVLRSALAIWGGPPLSDFTYEEFAQAHIRQLSELRLAALEELAAAELDLGAAPAGTRSWTGRRRGEVTGAGRRLAWLQRQPAQRRRHGCRRPSPEAQPGARR